MNTTRTAPAKQRRSEQLVYDDLRRFCDARMADMASIVSRSQFLLVTTSSLYAAYFVLLRLQDSFSLLLGIAGLVMVPPVLLLFYVSRPLAYRDDRLDFSYIHKKETETWIPIILHLENLADELSWEVTKRGSQHRKVFFVWLISLVASLCLICIQAAQ